jgi:hypothetical protein
LAAASRRAIADFHEAAVTLGASRTGGRVFDPTSGRTTSPHSSSTGTATTSKPSSVHPNSRAVLVGPILRSLSLPLGERRWAFRRDCIRRRWRR